MLTTRELENEVRKYEFDCKSRNRPPTRCGLSNRLGISRQTVCNVVNGYYAPHRPYTDKPSKTRIISNNDFKLITRLFNEVTEGL